MTTDKTPKLLKTISFNFGHVFALRIQFIVFVFHLFITFILHFHNSFMYSLCEYLFRCVLKFKLLHPPLSSNNIVFNSISNVCAFKFLHMYLLCKCIKQCLFVYLISPSWRFSTNDYDTCTVPSLTHV